MQIAVQVSTALVLPHLLFGLITLAVVFYLPGYLLLTRRLAAGTPALERWTLQATLGFWSVALATSLLLLLPFRWIGLEGIGLAPYLVVAASAAVSTLAWAVHRRRRPAKQPRATLGDRVALGTAAAFFGLFFIGIDGQAHTPWCLYEPLDQLMQGPADEAPSLLFDLGTYERLGNVAANLLPFSLYEMAGVRVASGLFAALMFLSTAALARRITGRTWAGIAAGALLMFTGDVLGSQVVNVNMIAAWLAAVFLLLIQPGHRSLGVERTFVAAALFCSRYMALLSMGALLVVMWRDRRDGESHVTLLRRFAVHGALFALFSLPVHLFHLYTVGSPFAYRALEEYSAHPHVFLGIPFTLHTMLNVPFFTELVRTPFNPFPMWIGWPVHAFRQWGVLGLSMILLGGTLLVRQAREQRTLVSWGLFAAPMALFLLIQENWIQPEKLTIGLLLAPVATSALAVALVWLTGPPRRARIGIAVGALILVAGGTALAGAVLQRVSFPEDPRFRTEYPTLRQETAEFSDLVRARWLGPKWSSLADDAGVLRGFGRKARAAGRVIGDPGFPQRRISPWHWILGEIDPTLVAEPRPQDQTIRDELNESHPFSAAEATRRLGLALGESPMVAQAPLDEARAPATDGTLLVDLTDGRRCASTPDEGQRFAFMDTPGRVVACRAGPDQVYLAVSPPPPPPSDEDLRECLTNDEEEYERGQSFCGAILQARERAAYDREAFARQPPTPAVTLLLPDAIRHIVLVEVVHLVPMRIYVRDVSLGSDTVEHGEPRPWRHN